MSVDEFKKMVAVKKKEDIDLLNMKKKLFLLHKREILGTFVCMKIFYHYCI
jgi:hypothetical protein